MRELMRRKLLEDMYDRMSEEEKRTFVQLTLQDIVDASGESLTVW